MPTWLTDTLRNPRAWALLAALTADLFGVLDNVVTPEVAILAAMGSLSAYFLSSAVAEHARATVKAAQLQASATRALAAPAEQPTKSSGLRDGHALPPK